MLGNDRKKSLDVRPHEQRVRTPRKTDTTKEIPTGDSRKSDVNKNGRPGEVDGWYGLVMSGLELHEAASLGDYDSLEDYLTSGKYDVNMVDIEWDNRTALHWASEKGYVECMRLLLEWGARPNARTGHGLTPAHLAAESGKLTSLRALHVAEVSIDRPDVYDVTPRRMADIHGNSDCVAFLLQSEKEIESKILAGHEYREKDPDYDLSVTQSNSDNIQVGLISSTKS